MRVGRFVAIATSAVLALGVCVGVPASADNADDQRRANAAASAVGDDLQDANAKVSAAIADLEEARAGLPEARRVQQQATSEAAAAKEADLEAQAVLEQATAAAIRAEQERAEVEFQIKDLQSRVGNLVREVYQNGAFADLDLLITSESPTELADRAAAIDAVSRANNKTLARMAEIRAELALKEARLEVLRQQVEVKRQQAAAALAAAKAAQARALAAKKRVEKLVAKRASALEVASTQRAKVLAQYRSVQAEQRRIADLLASAAAAEAGRVAAGGQPAGGTPSGEFVWPMPGRSAGGGVGPRIHPVYGYRSCHTGVDIGAPSGTPIHATAAGIVVSVASGGPYGNHTLISHGGGIASMYAHQSRFGVSVGQRVSAGQVIGYVGSTGYTTGPHLHFEIHVGGVPYNPMGWFGGPRTPVRC